MMKRNSRRHLILASSSPRRQQLIRTLQLPVMIHSVDVDESYPEGAKPSEIVEQLALRKAAAVYDLLRAGDAGQAGLIVGADTIVVFRDVILGKPRDRAHARDMLEMLQGKSHAVFSGVALIDADTGEAKVGHRKTLVRMKPLDRRRIEQYVATGEPDDKAGAYAIQGLGAMLIDTIEGCYFNVVGLPLSLLHDLLGEFGVDPFDSPFP